MIRFCTTCKKAKSIEDFGKDAYRSDGISGRCKPCLVAKTIAWNKANREKKNANNRKHALTKRAYYAAFSKRWRQENADAVREKDRQRYPLIKHRIVASNKRRKALLINACPSWANRFFIDEAYELARLRTESTGIEWHVDHIVPLRSKVVCGLHVESNLQVIPAAVNLRKQNFYWPDMPEAA